MEQRTRGTSRAQKSVSQKLPDSDGLYSPAGYLRRNISDDETSGSDSRDEEETNTNESEEFREVDADEPRIAQWEGEDEDESISIMHAQEDRGEGSSRLPQPKESSNGDFSSLSFGSLLKARRILDRARVEDFEDSDGSDSNDDTVELEIGAEDAKHGKSTSSQDSPKPQRPEKRPHKHAPVELTSKRPVTRRRQVVEVKKVNYRDPRFSPLDNDDARQAFRKNYSFLADMHKTEFETLKENFRRARKMLRSSPRDQRDAWEEEVNRLARAHKRAESSVNRDRNEEIERRALEQARKEEMERRKAGKGEWHMKKSATKEILLKARHDALAATGGRLAVRKAIEKRQKRVSQKEKRQRPVFSDRRQHVDGSESNKRRKLSE